MHTYNITRAPPESHFFSWLRSLANQITDDRTECQVCTQGFRRWEICRDIQRSAARNSHHSWECCGDFNTRTRTRLNSICRFVWLRTPEHPTKNFRKHYSIISVGLDLHSFCLWTLVEMTKSRPVCSPVLITHDVYHRLTSSIPYRSSCSCSCRVYRITLWCYKPSFLFTSTHYNY